MPRRLILTTRSGKTMMKIIKLRHPDCVDCDGCTKAEEGILCKDCRFNRNTIMHREKTLCSKLHAWVEPCDYCAWGEVEE